MSRVISKKSGLPTKKDPIPYIVLFQKNKHLATSISNATSQDGATHSLPPCFPCSMIATSLLLFIFVTTLSFPKTGAFVTPLHSSSKTQQFVLQAHSEKEWDLNVAIVGAGPSGLLLAHKLLRSNIPVANIDVFESRADPRDLQKQQGSRAYALGLGIRGRSAIRTVDEELWAAVKERGFECERFRLHLSQKLNVKLRDREEGVEPSVLIYQTDLCSGLLDELETR